jgi:nucleotide-binding universal stress UspA family protein
MIEYPTKVLLATDGTEDSARAVEAVVALCARTGAELHVAHVGRIPSYATGTTVEGRSLPGTPPEYAERQGRKVLERQVEGIRASGGTVAGSYLRMGQPAYELVGLGDELGADMLVVGSGRPRAMRRAVSGATRRAALGATSDDGRPRRPLPGPGRTRRTRLRS